MTVSTEQAKFELYKSNLLLLEKLSKIEELATEIRVDLNVDHLEFNNALWEMEYATADIQDLVEEQSNNLLKQIGILKDGKIKL